MRQISNNLAQIWHKFADRLISPHSLENNKGAVGGGAVRFRVKSSAISVPRREADTNSKDGSSTTLQPGQPFNPYGLFHGIFIPEALVRYPDLSPGAKIAYGRLVRYAGQDGACHPRQETLAREIGISDRQVRTYLQELTAQGFLKIIRKGLHAPNDYVFLWHEVFIRAGRKETSGQDRNYSSGQQRKETSGPIPRESVQESPSKESEPSSSSCPDKTSAQLTSLNETTSTTTGTIIDQAADRSAPGVAAPRRKEPEPEVRLVYEALRQIPRCNPSLDDARSMIGLCRKAEPLASIESIVTTIQQKAPGARRKDNPMGWLLTLVPKSDFGALPERSEFTPGSSKYRRV